MRLVPRYPRTADERPPKVRIASVLLRYRNRNPYLAWARRSVRAWELWAQAAPGLLLP